MISIKCSVFLYQDSGPETADQVQDAHDETSKDDEDSVISMPVTDPHLCTTQNVRAIVSCVECCKPRAIYSRHKLTDRQLLSVVLATSEFDYTCGSPLLPPQNNLYKTVMCRSNMTCSFPVELQYYSSGLGRNDICCLCADEDAEVDQELKKTYKTVLPLCDNCKNQGKTSIVSRPF